MSSILFSGPMIRVILAGRKTQTRRIVGLTDFCPSTTRGYDWEYRDRRALWNSISNARLLEMSPYGAPGDRLIVRETWRTAQSYDGIAPSALPPDAPIWFDADDPDERNRAGDGGIWPGVGWTIIGRGRPSIHLPHALSRITLEVTSIRVERLQAISEADARAEGCESHIITEIFHGQEVKSTFTACESFAFLWDSINADRAPWSENCWVWCVSFKVVTP